MATAHYVLEAGTNIHKTFKSYEMARQFMLVAPGDWEYLGVGTEKEFPSAEAYEQVRQ